VLISGLGGTLGFWDQLVDALGADLRTIRFDQRGIAGSERGSAPITIRTLADDAWQVIDALAVERPILCGHSTGGAIVQEMALMRPGASAGLVLSGSWAGPNPYMDALFTLRLDMLTHLPHHYARMSALIASIFLGGWNGPTWDGSLPASITWIFPILWFALKTFAIVFVFFWVRTTLPRLRYDQLMELGWKRLIPGTLIWMVFVAVALAFDEFGAPWA